VKSDILKTLEIIVGRTLATRSRC